MRRRFVLAHARSRVTAAVLALTLLGGGLAGTPGAAATRGSAPTVTDTEAEAEAMAAAQRLGRPVEVRNARTESSRVLATPQGSLLLESYAAPRWTKGADGAWRQIDTTLRSTAHGIAPVAALADISFSPGGAAPAVRLPVGGGEVTLSWPGPLPAPRLEGDTAVYESVLPGVDLRMRALADGFGWVLVVKSVEAAADPALETVRFGIVTDGLTRRVRAGGGFEVLDGSGRVVLSAGSALMWDSSGLTSGRSARTEAFAAQERREAVRSAPDLARKAELPAGLRGDELVIRPDLALLRGARTVYPVVIDPWTTLGKLRWGYAGSTNASRDDGVARVGDSPDGSGIYRSFFAFSLSSLRDKTIRSAKFLTEMTHSWSCDSSTVNLWRTADLTTAGRQNWSGPGLQLWLEERSGHAHKPSGGAGCTNDPQPDMPMEFSGANLKNDVTSFRGDSNYTLVLTTRRSDGSSEATDNLWKKFDPAMTKLSIEYNTDPYTATASQLSTYAGYTAPAQGCVTGSLRPAVRSDYPWLKATLTDPDGSNGGSLSGTFSLQKQVNGVWTAVSGWPRTDSGVAPGAKAEVQLVTKTVNGEIYRWQVQTRDTLGGSSDWSTWCEFSVDYSPPAYRPAVTAADGLYLESPPRGTNQDVHGSPGYSGRFTFSANGAGDVYDYVYQVQGGTEMVARAPSLGGSVTVWVTPDSIGENVLTVRSRDQSGNRSEPYEYVFLVDTASAPKAAWSMNEGTGTTLAATLAGGPSATLANGAGWRESRILGVHKNTGKDWAVGFDGTDDFAETTGAVLDTSRSFTVAAWVRLASTAKWAAVVCQNGATANAPFDLEYGPDTGQWAFNMYSKDGSPTTVRARSAGVAKANVWVHLAASWDAGDKKARVYVDGKLSGTADVASSWMPAGNPKLQIGREHWLGSYYNYFNGDIDDVRVWDRAIDPDLDLAPLAQPTLVGQWEMEDVDDEAPRQVSDESGYQRPATLADTASTAPSGLATWWDPAGYNYSTGLGMDGKAGFAETAAPVLRTDQSFTVSAWVRYTGGDPVARTTVAQEGNVVSNFMLGCRIGSPSVWAVIMAPADSTAGPNAMASGNTCQLDRWTHIAAVHDAAAGRVSLYVDGAFVSSAPVQAAWQANSVFSIGRSKWYTSPRDLGAGTIDRVRAWQGALTAADVAAVFAEA
ncbi:LamG domain-containing protein [Micromonospora auratinigra]|uniref:Concanavalin A-like lectin/glucanases superfamily protein n=1 Tax=Micromonospora auratinigra TaxID=261654 RepID=A0A1A8Z2U6_9ACTN|nr:LamG domain-containing protein [Micromonospora auratinigra]SBT38132.1 Concanavalin A-like lectin/glucanases superfamily protein [Micromonospora auratinigra]